MSRQKQIATVTDAARNAARIASNLAGRVLALQTEAKRIDTEETARRSDNSLQLICANESLSAVIKTKDFTFQIEGKEFAVTSRG